MKYSGVAGGTLFSGVKGGTAMSNPLSRVVLVKTEDRKYGMTASLRTLKINPVKGKSVLIKPNFNTADTFPGSTHNDTLAALIEEIWKMGQNRSALERGAIRRPVRSWREKRSYPSWIN